MLQKRWDTCAVKFDFQASWKHYPSQRTKLDFNQGMRSATITEGSVQCESTEWCNTLLTESARCVCSFRLSVSVSRKDLCNSASSAMRQGQDKRSDIVFSWIADRNKYKKMNLLLFVHRRRLWSFKTLLNFSPKTIQFKTTYIFRSA